MNLHVNKYSENLYFRGFTNKLDKNSLKSIAAMGKIKVVIDLTKHPDTRWQDFTEFISCHIPEGHTASVMQIERLSEAIQEMSKTKNVLVISYFGKNRAPAICAMADPSNKEALIKEGFLTKDFFRSLV